MKENLNLCLIFSPGIKNLLININDVVIKIVFLAFFLFFFCFCIFTVKFLSDLIE